MSDIALRCKCGHVVGVAENVSPSQVFRFICYCADCRAFARFLDRPDVLDSAGGTEIFQLAPARVKLLAGVDALRCVQFSAKVLRWYADCCRTPLANTAGPSFPLIAISHAFVDRGVSYDPVLGPPLCRIYERSATGPLPADAPPPPSIRVFMRRSVMLLRWWMRGLHRPNPFFNERYAPRAHPARP